MKKIVILAVISMGVFAPAFAAESALEIVTRSRDRIQADTIRTTSRMEITAKNGSKSERVIDQYAKEGAKGYRTLIEFQKPSSVAGTRFLTMETGGGADDRWIYLPSLGKLRRIAASEGSGSFVGTDFSYDDISSADRDAALDTHTVLREEALNGKMCFVIESLPKDKIYEYAKMISWIDKETLVAYKLELFDKKQKLVKTLEVLEVKDIQGRLTPVATRMTTAASGTSTTIFVDSIVYDAPIAESYFSTAYLETGRK